MDEKLEPEPTVELGSLTTMKSEIFSYTWTIENFADFVDRVYEVLSPTFCFDHRSEVKWRLAIHPENSYPKGVQVALCLMKVSFDGKTQSVRYKISAIDEDGNHVLLQNRDKLFRHVTDFDNCLLIPHKDLIIKKLLPDGGLVIRCEMDVLSCENSSGSEIDCTSLLNEQLRECNDFNNLSVDSLLEEKESKLVKECDSVRSFNISKKDLKLENSLCKSDMQMDLKLSSDLCKIVAEMDTKQNSDLYKSDVHIDSKLNSNLHKKDIQLDSIFDDDDLCKNDVHMDSLTFLSQDLKNLYANKKLCDVRIRTASAEICCHKIILLARSEYFRKAFEGNDKDSLVITGVKSTTMEAILYYLYTGKLRDLTVEFAIDILTASRKFELLHLQNILVEYLKRNMNIVNVTDILQVAEDLDLEDLKLHCLKCASSHQLELTKTEKWDYLLQNNPHAAGEVLLTIASFQKRNIL